MEIENWPTGKRSWSRIYGWETKVIRLPYLVILGEAEGGCFGELGHPGGHDVDGGLLHPVAELKVVAPGGGVAGGVQVAPVVLLCNKVPLLSGYHHFIQRHASRPLSGPCHISTGFVSILYLPIWASRHLAQFPEPLISCRQRTCLTWHHLRGDPLKCLWCANVRT